MQWKAVPWRTFSIGTMHIFFLLGVLSEEILKCIINNRGKQHDYQSNSHLCKEIVAHWRGK